MDTARSHAADDPRSDRGGAKTAVAGVQGDVCGWRKALDSDGTPAEGAAFDRPLFGPFGPAVSREAVVEPAASLVSRHGGTDARVQPLRPADTRCRRSRSRPGRHRTPALPHLRPGARRLGIGRGPALEKDVGKGVRFIFCFSCIRPQPGLSRRHMGSVLHYMGCCSYMWKCRSHRSCTHLHRRCKNNRRIPSCCSYMPDCRATDRYMALAGRVFNTLPGYQYASLVRTGRLLRWVLYECRTEVRRSVRHSRYCYVKDRVG